MGVPSGDLLLGTSAVPFPSYKTIHAGHWLIFGFVWSRNTGNWKESTPNSYPPPTCLNLRRKGGIKLDIGLKSSFEMSSNIRKDVNQMWLKEVIEEKSHWFFMSIPHEKFWLLNKHMYFPHLKSEHRTFMQTLGKRGSLRGILWTKI